MLILYIVALLITSTAFCAYPLHDAVKSNRIGDLRTLIAAGADVNATDQYGDTPLHNAADKGWEGAIRILLAAGAKVNATTEDGYTPLHIAAFWKNIDTTAALIAAGADVNKTNQYGNTPLYYAVCLGNTSAVRTLIAAGADANIPNGNDNDTPLHTAVTRANIDIVRVLIDAGTHLDEKLLELLRSKMPELVPLACAHNPATFKFLRQLTRQGEFDPEQLEQIRIQCAGIQRKHMDSLLTDSCSSETPIRNAKLIDVCKQQGIRNPIALLQNQRRGRVLPHRSVVSPAKKTNRSTTLDQALQQVSLS